MRNLAIKVDGKREIERVLKALDSYGLKWANGTSATKFTPPFNTKVICVGYRAYNEITYGSDMGFRPNWKHELLTAEEFLRRGVEQIVIERNNRKITASDNKGNHASARCCPDDDFDFYTGAKLALERLEKQAKGFQPGQFVEVIDEGKSYCTLPAYFFNGSDELRHYAFGHSLKEGRIARVIRTRNEDDKVYVECCGVLYVIGAKGLRKV